MYTYLNQKYGLKSLIIEWASTIIHSIKIYIRDDHQVTLFAKILKMSAMKNSDSFKLM
jgi:hypothetical protein